MHVKSLRAGRQRGDTTKSPRPRVDLLYILLAVVHCVLDSRDDSRYGEPEHRLCRASDPHCGRLDPATDADNIDFSGGMQQW